VWDDETGDGRGAIQHYPTANLGNIKAIPAGDWFAPDSLMYMWVTDTHLDQGIDLLEAWGFKFVTVGFYWMKLRKRFDANQWTTGREFVERSFHTGMGYYTRANPEQCIIGKRGRGLPRAARDVRRLVVSPLREHSRKPDRVRDDLVRLHGDVPRLEMFARTSPPGWVAWGNQTDKFAAAA
jgi:N6-adenosine-specific RNA methylase IME4